MVVDTAHGHTKGVIEMVRWIKQHYPEQPGDRRQPWPPPKPRAI